MSVFRALLVVVIAVAVAALPMANPMASSLAHDKSLATSFSHSDCCQSGKDCESKGMMDCGSMAGCALKCFNLTGDTGPGVVGKLRPATKIEFALANHSSGSYSASPALPPPRA